MLDYFLSRVHQDCPTPVQPAEKRFNCRDSPGEALGRTGNSALMFQPVQEVVQIASRDGTQCPVRWQNLRQQAYIR
jgi:hypothetical protein